MKNLLAIGIVSKVPEGKTQHKDFTKIEVAVFFFFSNSSYLDIFLDKSHELPVKLNLSNKNVII